VVAAPKSVSAKARRVFLPQLGFGGWLIFYLEDMAVNFNGKFSRLFQRFENCKGTLFVALLARLAVEAIADTLERGGCRGRV